MFTLYYKTQDDGGGGGGEFDAPQQPLPRLEDSGGIQYDVVQYRLVYSRVE